jgi:hypothetical protein
MNIPKRARSNQVGIGGAPYRGEGIVATGLRAGDREVVGAMLA